MPVIFGGYYHWQIRGRNLSKVFDIDERTGELYELDERAQRQYVAPKEYETRYVAPKEYETRYVAPSGAIRDNKAKTRYDLVPLDVLDGAARVFSIGEKKYGRWNWRKGFPPEETVGSVMRHLAGVQRAIEIEDKDGTKLALLDAESGEAHAHHLLCSVLILIDSMRKAGFKI